MVQMNLALFINTSIATLALTSAVNWQPAYLADLVAKRTKQEFLLHFCGALESGFKNLEDAVEISGRKSRPKLATGLQYLQELLLEAQSSGGLPDEGACQRQLPNNLKVNVTSYRLNEIDQPDRRLNWSYRLTMSDLL